MLSNLFLLPLIFYLLSVQERQFSPSVYVPRLAALLHCLRLPPFAFGEDETSFTEKKTFITQPQDAFL